MQHHTPKMRKVRSPNKTIKRRWRRWRICPVHREDQYCWRERRVDGAVWGAVLFLLFTTSMASAAGGGADQTLAFAGSSDAYAIQPPYPIRLTSPRLSVVRSMSPTRYWGRMTSCSGQQFWGAMRARRSTSPIEGDLLVGLVDDDAIIDLGSNFGPNVDLTFSEPGIYVIGGVVPEPSTWAMMLLGFGGLVALPAIGASRRTATAG